MKYPKDEFTYLWNDLPIEERKRMMPHAIESHRLHLVQSKQKAIRAHRKLMKDFYEHIESLNQELSKYKREINQ